MRVKYGIAVEGLNGSAGGTTAARNKSREYFKVRTAPRNPRTVDQSLARARLSGMSKSWGDLTNEQRLQWDEFAKTQKGRRVLGVAGVLSGFNAFCRIQLNATLAEFNAALTPPTNLVIPELVELVVTNVTATGVNINAKALVPNVAGESGSISIMGRLVVEMTPVLRKGRASDPTALRFIALSMQGTTTGQSGQVVELRGADVSEPFATKFGSTLKAGDKVQVSVKFVFNGDGQVGLSTLKYSETIIIPEVPAP